METLEVHAVAEQDRRTISRVLRAALFASLAVAAVLLLLLASATSNTQFFSHNYPTLLTITIGVAALLALLAFDLLRRLLGRYRKGVFGARLMARMAGAFVLMSVLPLTVVFFVAVQFAGRSIESWFDVPLERALESSLNLARATLEGQTSELVRKARAIRAELADSAQPAQQVLSRMCESGAQQECTLFTSGGRVIASSGGLFTRLLPDMPTAEFLRQARLTREATRIEPTEADSEHSLKLRVIVSAPSEAGHSEEGWLLQLIQPVPPHLGENADAVERGYRDFRELSIARAGLKRIFTMTLTLTFLLTLFSAVSGAFLLAGWLTGPLSELAAATRSLAAGEFRRVKNYRGRDELGVLTESFNTMTEQLEDARSLAQNNQNALERANTRLESILANLDAAVMVLDDQWRLTLANPGADRLVGEPLSDFLGQPLGAVPRIGQLADAIRAAFNENATAGAGGWQRQFQLARTTAAGDATPAPWNAGGSDQTLLARGSLLAQGQSGYVIVLDDVTAVISAQRASAWAEVARRLAHEIKNPLTPVQLAAERLEHKLGARLAGADAEFLSRSTRTIVNQVHALKTLVDEFRDYARLPTGRLEPLDLNALVEEVCGLYEATSGPDVIETDLQPDLPSILGDATQLRQVTLNLLKNGLEAAERSPEPRLRVRTQHVRLADASSAVRLELEDNGEGFSADLLARAFEPYVTSKPRGTGLGLAIVRKIVEEHGARIELANRLDAAGGVEGARVSILFTKLVKTMDNSAQPPGPSPLADRDTENG